METDTAVQQKVLEERSGLHLLKGESPERDQEVLERDIKAQTEIRAEAPDWTETETETELLDQTEKETEAQRLTERGTGHRAQAHRR